MKKIFLANYHNLQDAAELDNRKSRHCPKTVGIPVMTKEFLEIDMENRDMGTITVSISIMINKNDNSARITTKLHFFPSEVVTAHSQAILRPHHRAMKNIFSC